MNEKQVVQDAIEKLKCGVCSHPFFDCQTNLLGSKEGHIFVQVVCSHCKASFFIILCLLPGIEFRKALPPLTEAYQIEMGRFLENYKGDLKGLLG